MKKYGKLIAFTVLAYFVAVVPAFAKNFTLESFGEKAEQIAEEENGYAGYAYVIGEYAFTSVHTLTVQDIMLAARSIKLGENKTLETDESDGYGDMAIHYLVNNGNGWTIDTNQVGSSKIEPDEKFNVVYIDYKLVAENYIEDDVDPAVDAAVADLNKDAAKNGFNEVTFTEEKVGETVQKTITFAVHDLNRKVSTYAQTAADMFKKVLVDSDLELKQIEYTLTGEEGNKVVTKDQLTEAEIIKFAKELIGNMTGKSNGELTNVTYADLIGKSAHATFVFEVDGHEYKEDYYVTFTYDFEEDKDVDLTAAADELDKEVKADPKYGFREITYDAETKTAEFAIQDDSVKLATFVDSGIVDMFVNYITGATKVEYTFGNTTKTITFDGQNQPNATNAVKWAKELLCLMGNHTSDESNVQNNDSCDATKLILADVAGKEATAKITYQLNDGETKEITYTLRFTYDLEDVKNYELTESAKSLDEEVKSDEAKEKDYGFSSVTYDADTKTVEFEVSNEGSKLVNFATSGIMEMFVRFADNATKTEYTIGNQKYTETIKDTTLSGTDVKKFAARLLMRMAGKTVTEEKLAEEAANLTVADVAGKEATATFTFVVDGEETTIDYTVRFNYNVTEVKDEELTTFADALNETLKDAEGTKYGFESIAYDEADHKVTFQASKDSDSVTLVTFAGTGIIDMFQTFITNATKVEYKVNGETESTTVNFTELAEGESAEQKIMELAANLLLKMAGKTVQSGEQPNWGDAIKLTVKDIAGKTAEATFTYKGEDGVEVPMTFKLEFKAAATEAGPQA